MTPGGNPQSKPDFGMPVMFVLLMVLFLFIDPAPLALLMLVFVVLSTHEAVKGSREG